MPNPNNPYGTYTDATGKDLNLTGTLGEQNLAANKIAGAVWKPTPATPAPVATPTGTIPQITPPTGTISSKDGQAEYDALGKKIEKLEPVKTAADLELEQLKAGDTKRAELEKTLFGDTTEGTEGEKAIRLAKEKADYEAKLSSLGSEYQDQINSTTSRYEELIKSKEKLRDLDIGRRKGYGTAASFYDPTVLEATDWATSEYTNEINNLVTQKGNELARLKTNYDNGKLTASRANTENIDKINESIRVQLENENKRIDDEINRQKAIITAQYQSYNEAGQLAAQKALAGYYEQWKNAKTPEEKKAVIEEAMRQGSVNFADLNEYSVAFKAVDDALIAKQVADRKTTYETEKQALELKKIGLDITGKQLDIVKTQKEIKDMGGVTPQGAPVPVQPEGTGGYAKENLVSDVTKLKLTEGQANSFSFATRLIEANKAINKIIADGYDPTTVVSGVGRVVSSDQAREFNRQMENFARAQLRKESGATITDEEIEGTKKLFDPSGFGKDEKDISATEQTRLQAVQSMIGQAGEAGNALNKYLQSEGLGTKTKATLAEDDIKEIQTILGGSPKFNPSSFFK